MTYVCKDLLDGYCLIFTESRALLTPKRGSSTKARSWSLLRYSKRICHLPTDWERFSFCSITHTTRSYGQGIRSADARIVIIVVQRYQCPPRSPSSINTNTVNSTRNDARTRFGQIKNGLLEIHTSYQRQRLPPPQQLITVLSLGVLLAAYCNNNSHARNTETT